MSHAAASLVYRRAVTAQASPVGLVIALCDTLVADLQRAIAAMRRTELGAIEDRSNQLKHALQVLGQLNALLDTAHGGACAQNLARFYEHLRQRILAAQFQKSTSILETETRNILEVRAAWQQVDSRAQQPATNNPPLNAEVAINSQANRESFSCSA
jgi:flagellar biosynthetic protein FliS